MNHDLADWVRDAIENHDGILTATNVCKYSCPKCGHAMCLGKERSLTCPTCGFDCQLDAVTPERMARMEMPVWEFFGLEPATAEQMRTWTVSAGGRK